MSGPSNRKADVMRQNYRELSDAEKQRMTELKQKGQELVELLHAIGGTAIEGPAATRELNTAIERAEESVMWGVKHLTR